MMGNAISSDASFQALDSLYLLIYPRN